jgi:tetratricopeptide (TPR) repeat protein
LPPSIYKSLAQVYRDKHRLPEAEEHLSQGLANFDKDLRATGYDRGGALLNLGFVCSEQGRYTEAEPLLVRAVATYEGFAPASAHPDLANGYFQLAELYRLEGKFSETEAQYLKALAIQEKAVGPENKTTIDSLDGLAMAYQGQGKTAKAKKLLARVSQFSRKTSGPGGGLDGGTLSDLGSVAEGQGKYTQAESLFLLDALRLGVSAVPPASATTRAIPMIRMRIRMPRILTIFRY